jgi:hypothetical protein
MAIKRNDLVDMLVSIIRKNSHASKEQHSVMFEKALQDPSNQEYLYFCLRTVFGLNYGKADRIVYSPTETEELLRKERQKEREEIKNQHSQIWRDRFDWYNLLDQTIPPYNKPLRMFTVSELITTADWMIRACEGYEPNELIGNIFTNNDLREIWEKHKSEIGDETHDNPFH